MKTFKQYFIHQQIIEENRRSFLKTLFGTGAAAAVSNPVQIADIIAKRAGSKWIELKLFTGEGLAPFGAFSVDADNIDALTSPAGMVPGVSKDGGIMIDYNKSDLGEMTVYVKPGSDMHAKASKLVGTVERGGHDFKLKDHLEDGVHDELGKAVHDAINNSQYGGAWLEKEIEKEQERHIADFEDLPDWQKDERADVDGIDEDSFPAEAQKGATDDANRFIRTGVEKFGAEVTDNVKDVVGRGYMKSYALGAGGGDESTMMDSMAELRDVYDDQEIDDPDEDDVYRWMEGEADTPYDKFRYSDDEPVDDDDEPVDDNEYEQPAGTGADTSWDDGMGNVLSLSQVLAHAVERWRDRSPQELKHLMIPTERDPARVQAADTSEPLLIAYDGMKPIKILDGQHRLQKALNTGMQKVPITRVDVNSDPKLKQMFDPEPEPNENI